ncbi:hypothetical protein J4E81_007971 [Alternaria sp. BMP 2799]|nr:hypothetical protein J4E81_007971 [Alternaria sp. BMP 2799]
MIQQQALQRYYSRDKLQKFLRNKFGDNINFNIQRAGEEYLTFEAPELLTADMKPACTSLTQSLVTFETLKEVRAVENKILPLEPILVSFEKLMKDLEEANSVFSEVGKVQDGTSVVIKAALRQFRKDATSYRRQVLYMNKRAQLTTQSMLDTLNLSQSKNTFDMGRSAREDSVAIRAITLVTSFYLPFSFVATMFGMNLVDFDSESRNLVLSKQLWLYFVISVPYRNGSFLTQ